MTRPRRLRPSDSFTMIRSGPSMTWWLVRMLPSASMMKPLPAPRRVPSFRDPVRSDRRDRRGETAGRRRRLSPTVAGGGRVDVHHRRVDAARRTSAKLTRA